MLLVGTQTNDPDTRIRIDFDGLLHHTLIVGQSGSGKSFFMARLLEEILLRTRARIIVIDPNGDFRNISSASTSVWTKLGSDLDRLNTLSNTASDESFDERATFEAGWAQRRFTYLVPGRVVGRETAQVLKKRVFVHWDTLDDEQTRFLLNMHPEGDAKLLLGLEAVTENAKWLQEQRSDVGFDLRGLQNASEQFALRNVNLKDYEYAKSLTTDDWYAVRAKIKDLLTQYTLWWSRDRYSATRPPGISDFVDGPFLGHTKPETYWDALVLSLDAARPVDTLLAVDVALSRVWHRAKEAWRTTVDTSRQDLGYSDDRVPTFVVVDEAHNFAPEHSTDPLRSRVTARLMQIASEGRKYGLYLVLATQRPTKLHRELVPECENSCVLRVQSEVEVDFACKVLGIPEKQAGAVPSFTRGQGLFVGRWVKSPVPVDTKIAPARTIVGGGGIPEGWKLLPSRSPRVREATEMVREATEIDSQVADFVRVTLEGFESALPLVQLADLVREEFDQIEGGDWLGRPTFKALLIDLNIEGLTLMTSVPPGYAYLTGLHAPPDLATSGGLAVPGLCDEVKEAIKLAHGAIGLPMLPSESFGVVLRSLSDAVQNSQFNLTDVSKAVRDACRASGRSIGRNAVNYVIKGIYLYGHRYDSDLPQTPDVLAEAFVRSVLESCRLNGLEFDSKTTDALSRHLSGGIIAGTPDRHSSSMMFPETSHSDDSSSDDSSSDDNSPDDNSRDDSSSDDNSSDDNSSDDSSSDDSSSDDNSSDDNSCSDDNSSDDNSSNDNSSDDSNPESPTF